MTPTALYRQHNRTWADHRFVYPVVSRRSRGLSIGVNLNPDKVCNYDCVYCSVDRTVPGADRRVDLGVVERELGRMLDLASGGLFEVPPFDQTPAALRRLNDVAFSGDGEPTSSPVFGEACRLAVRCLEARGLDAVKLVVITNGTLLDRPEVAATLRSLDGHRLELWAKLDAGSEAWHARVNRSRIPLERVVANIAAAGRERPLVIQSMFLRLGAHEAGEAEVSAWLERLRRLRDEGCRIDRVQIYTVARATAERFAQPVALAALEAVAERVRALGLAAETFG